MSKNDELFDLLAEALAEQDPANWGEPNLSENVQWQSDVRAIASVCTRFVDNFDYEQFYVKAGLGVTSDE